MVPSRPPNLQKTEEKLKNPQQPNTQAPESQEGLKTVFVGVCQDVLCNSRISRRVENSLRLLWLASSSAGLLPESQEGLKIPRRRLLHGLRQGARISRRVEKYVFFSDVDAGVGDQNLKKG